MDISRVFLPSQEPVFERFSYKYIIVIIWSCLMRASVIQNCLYFANKVTVYHIVGPNSETLGCTLSWISLVCIRWSCRCTSSPGWKSLDVSVSLFLLTLFVHLFIRYSRVWSGCTVNTIITHNITYNLVIFLGQPNVPHTP